MIYIVEGGEALDAIGKKIAFICFVAEESEEFSEEQAVRLSTTS